MQFDNQILAALIGAAVTGFALVGGYKLSKRLQEAGIEAAQKEASRKRIYKLYGEMPASGADLAVFRELLAALRIKADLIPTTSLQPGAAKLLDDLHKEQAVVEERNDYDEVKSMADRYVRFIEIDSKTTEELLGFSYG